MINAQIQGLSGGLAQKQAPPKVKYCLYARKSTESEERQVLSIDSQIKEMLLLAEREGLEVITMKRESHSAKETGQRPIFNEIVEEIRLGKFNGILTWAPDRISRNAGDLGRIVDLMDQGLLAEIRTFSQSFSNNPNEKFLLMILGSQAKLENDNRGINVKRGLRTRCEMGLWPTMAPVGYMNQKEMDKRCQIMPDPQRAPIIKNIFEKVGYENWSGRKVYHWLRFELNFKSVGNHYISVAHIFRTLANTIYYGVFEYPRNSGNWYTGKHEPLITKELFDKVQEKLKRDGTKKTTSKEFAFTKLMVCGKCGSGLCAQEKYKQLKDGTVAKYIYYGCNRSIDKNCKGKYIREDELISQICNQLDKINYNDFGIQVKFEDELKRFNKFQKGVLQLNNSQKKHRDIDYRTYIKYTLREGSDQEKRELMGCFKSRIKVTEGVVNIE